MTSLEACDFDRFKQLDLDYAWYPDWKKLDWRWRWRLTHKEYTPLNGEKLPSALVPKLLLKLYEGPSYQDLQHFKIRRRTLAACRLVCRQWSRIVTSKWRQFSIQVDKEEWPSPPWYILQRTALPLQDGGKRIQENDTVWCTRNYTEDLTRSRPKFLPELARNIVPGFYRYVDKDSWWQDEKKSVIKSTLAACCLVSREWNRNLTPFLYGKILLDEKNPLRTQSLLHHTLRHVKPAHKALVKTMMIAPTDDGSTATILSICFSMPNLRKLILDFENLNPSTLHPNFVQQLRSLSKLCTIQMVEDGCGNVNVTWESFLSYIGFKRRCGLALGGFRVGHDESEYIQLYCKIYFSIGGNEGWAFGQVLYEGKYLQQCLTQAGHNLMGLYLSPSEVQTGIPKINLRQNTHLRLLQLTPSHMYETDKTRQDVVQWLNSICQSITSKSLVVQLYQLPWDEEICNKIQDIILALNARTMALSVYLSGEYRDGTIIYGRNHWRKRFPALYETGIVTEKHLSDEEAHALAFGR